MVCVVVNLVMFSLFPFAVPLGENYYLNDSDKSYVLTRDSKSDLSYWTRQIRVKPSWKSDETSGHWEKILWSNNFWPMNLWPWTIRISHNSIYWIYSQPAVLSHSSTFCLGSALFGSLISYVLALIAVAVVAAVASVSCSARICICGEKSCHSLDFPDIKARKLPRATRLTRAGRADPSANELHDGGVTPLWRMLETMRARHDSSFDNGGCEGKLDLLMTELAFAQRLHRRLLRHRARSLWFRPKTCLRIYIRDNKRRRFLFDKSW